MKEKTKTTGMKTAERILGLIVLVLITVVFLIVIRELLIDREIMMVNGLSIEGLTGKIGTKISKTQLRQVVQKQNDKIATLSDEMAKFDSIYYAAIVKLDDRIQDNNEKITENADRIQQLSESHQELSKVVWVHGYKVNRVVKLVFDLAYGSSDEGNTKWYQYTKCGNKPLWEEAISKLNLTQIQKLLKLNEIENEIQTINHRISQIKSRCFKK